MPTETKYMLLWVFAAFSFIALIISLWLLNSMRIQNVPAYGSPTDTAALASPHTPFIVAEQRPAATVASIAEALPDATQFASLLQSTGVDRALASGQPYTIFVPTDRALRQLPASIGSMTPAQL